MRVAAANPFEFHGFNVLVRDLDPQGHVANHVYVAYLSEARARFVRGFGDGADVPAPVRRRRDALPEVLVDPQTGRPRAIPPDVRARLRRCCRPRADVEGSIWEHGARGACSPTQ